MNLILFIILTFAVWRTSRILVSEVGPYKLVERFRNLIINEPWSPVYCFRCTSVWVAFIFAFLGTNLSFIGFIAAWMAMSGAAIIVDIWAESHTQTTTGSERKTKKYGVQV